MRRKHSRTARGGCRVNHLLRVARPVRIRLFPFRASLHHNPASRKLNAR